MSSSGAVVCYSGGCDSLTLLHVAMNDYVYDKSKVHAVSFDYDQRHIKEIEYAKKVCDNLKISHFIYDINLSFGRSPLVSREIEVPDQTENKQQLTVVPYRNTMFLVTAAAHATIYDFDTIYLGAVREDQAAYPDCRPAYFDSMQQALRLGDFNHLLNVETPFVTMPKSEVIHMGVNGFSLDYSDAWTCYKGGEIHCGTCDACVERKRSFAEAKIVDRTEYLS